MLKKLMMCAVFAVATVFSCIAGRDAPSGYETVGGAKWYWFINRVGSSDNLLLTLREVYSDVVTAPSTIAGYSVTSFNNVYDNNARTAVKNVIISEGIKEIAPNAFRFCNNLESVTIPNSAKMIGSSAFSNCSSLKSIAFPVEITDGRSYFGSPDIVSVIAPYMCSGCRSLMNVQLPNGVLIIDEYAFQNCTSLKNVLIPNSVKSIETGAFYMCSLESVNIPGRVTKIGSLAFKSCSSLKSLSIGYSVIDIKDEAFKGCSSLENVLIPNSVTNLGREAFSSCSALKRAKVPAFLKSQVSKNNVFSSCPLLTIEYYNVYDSLPEISEDPEVKAALDGAADTNLTANITNAVEYAVFRKWASELDDTTEAEVKQSPYSWLSYALDTDKLISSALKEEDLRINDFKPTHNVAEDGSIEFDLCASIGEIKIGDGATKDNLNKIFKIWGAGTLEGLMNKERRQEVEPSITEPSGGKAVFKLILDATLKFFTVEPNRDGSSCWAETMGSVS